MKASEREEAERERELLSQLEQLELHRKKTQELLASGKLQPVQHSRLQDLLGQVQGDVERTKAELASLRLEQELRCSEMVHREKESGRFTLYRVLFIALLAVFLAAGLYSALHAGDVTSAAVAVAELSTPKEHYLASEQPFFVVDMPEKEAALTGFFALSPLKIQLRDPLGRVAEVEQGIQKKGKARYVSFSPSASFRPGKYSLQLVQEGTVVQEQNFTWGVLALNPDRSAYRSGEEAFISMAVLDDQGSMVCDADVSLEIIAPDGVKTEFSTREGSIMVSEECKLYGITALPDYYTSYTMGMGEGNYALNLTATLPDGKKRTVMDVLRVNNSEPFYVARKGPTRIYPYDAYRMEISVEAQQEFSGEIRETVPAAFVIAPEESMTEHPARRGDIKTLSWDIAVAAGEVHTISYTFDAPDISPEMYLLGPLQLHGEAREETGNLWKETRQWQIASDALTGVTLDTPVADLSNVTGQEFTFTCTPTCDGVGDPASVVINYQYSTAADCSVPTDIDTNSGTTDVLSVDAQNDSTTCGAAITGLVTERNVGTVYVTCRAQAFPTGDFTGGCRQVAVAQGCGTISSNINMNQNLSSSGTCFTVNANHIVINCTNYGVNYGSGGSANTYGIDNNGFDNVTIKNCVIQEATATGTDKHGIFLQNGAIGTDIFNSSMRASGQSSQGISLQSGSNSTNITDIRVDTTGVNGVGLLFFHSSHNIIINTIVKTAAGTGVLLASAHNNTFEALNATATGQTQAVRIFDFSAGGTGMTNNIFLNLTAWSAVNYTLFDDSGITANNTLIYNSTFGVINWTLSNLTTNMTLWQGLTIFVENGTIGVRDEGALMEKINTSAKIVFRTLQYLVTPLLLKRGERCDNTIDCNITQDYDKAVGVLSVNVSSFSNYTLNSPPTHNAPVLNTTDVSVNGTNQNTTLYWQNASDPDQDSIKNITNWLLNGTSIMVLNMPFERVNGTSTQNAWDYSGYGNNGSASAFGPIWNATGGYDGRGAYEFNRSGTILIPHSNELELANGSITLTAWVRPTGLMPAQTGLFKKQGTDDYYLFEVTTNNRMLVEIRDEAGAGSYFSATSSSGLALNSWSHIAYIINRRNHTGGEVYLYINGTLDANRSDIHINDPIISGVQVIIGQHVSHYFNGTIDELQLYNRSLSKEQIRALYRNGTNLIVSQETTANQNWTADVTPNDGFSDGAPLRSNQVIVLGANSPPTHNAPILNTTDPSNNNTNQNLTLYPQNASDPDQDSIKNITNWLLNGTSIMLLNMPFERVNATSTSNAWDYSGYRNNGSDQGATWNSSGGYDGKGAYDFDSIDDYIHLGNVLGNLVGRDQFTIMAWINHDSGTGIQYIMVKNGPFIFYVQNSLLVGAIYNGTSWTYQGTNGKFRDNAWEHIAMVYNGSATGMYINGKLNTTGAKVGTLSGNGCVEIGRYNTGGCGVSPGNYFNGTIDEVKIYNRSLSAEQILALYNNRTDLIVSQETTSGQNWTADVTPNDGFSDGAPLRSNQVIVLGAAANTLPTAPVTGMPFNGSAITNRTPIFEWFNSSDADGDVISYHLQVDDNRLFNNPEINVSSIEDLSSSAPGNTTWYSSLGTTELAVDTTYFWRVRANDSEGFGPWSDGSDSEDGLGGGRNLSNFTVDSLLSVTFFTSAVEFGELTPGVQEDTADGSPAPFRAENTGNIDVNTSINGSQYFDNAQLNTSNYQFRIRENNTNAFATSLSDTNWRNMSKDIFAPNVVNLTWRSSKRDFLVDINVTVPTDEPSGVKRSIVTFTVVANQ